MSTRTRLHGGDMFPHIQVKTIDGGTFSYGTIWQHKNLVLVVLERLGIDDSDASAFIARAGDFSDRETECVITRDGVAGIHTPGVLVADRWGEIIHVVDASSSARLPSPDEVIEWLEYLRQRCPECEGEAR